MFFGFAVISTASASTGLSYLFYMLPDLTFVIFSSTNVLLGSIFLHMKASKLWQNLPKFPILSQKFPKISPYANFLWTNIVVIFVTNMSSVLWGLTLRVVTLLKCSTQTLYYYDTQSGRSCAKARWAFAENLDEILSTNICYFVGILRFVEIYTLFERK